MLAQLLCQFAEGHPQLHVALSVFDTQTVVERVADRTLELGVVGAARGTAASSTSRSSATPSILACPPGHAFAGRTITLDELKDETLIVMQEGAGVRQMIDDELQRAGLRLRDLDVRLELGLQESVTSAVRGGYGVTFISRSSVENDLAAGTLVEARFASSSSNARSTSCARPDAPRRVLRARSSSSRKQRLRRDRPLVARRAAGRARRGRHPSARS